MHIFHDFAFVPLPQSGFPPRAGSFLPKKRTTFCKKSTLKHEGAKRKQIVVMHALIFADGALGANNARHCSCKQYFEESTERKNDDRNSQKSEKSKSSDKK